MSGDDKDVAEDYRRQRQAAAAKIVGYKPRTKSEQLRWIDENREKLVKFIRGKGPASDDEAEIIEAYRNAVESTSDGSQFDDVNARQIVERVITEIEKVCKDNDIPTHAGVVFGTDPALGLGISQRPVLETRSSIIEVSIHFLSFINILAKLLALSIPYERVGEDEVRFIRNVDMVREVILNSQDLANDWTVFFATFATLGVQPHGLDMQLTEEQSTLKVLLIRALEIFSIGHEFGHHALRHGLAVTSEESLPDAFKDEYQADYFARQISLRIGSEEAQQNFYAVSGAGGVAILGALELLRRTVATLTTGIDVPPARLRHPPFSNRVECIGLADENLDEANREDAEEYRAFFVALLEMLWLIVKPNIVVFYEEGIRPTNHSLDSGGWLPS